MRWMLASNRNTRVSVRSSVGVCNCLPGVPARAFARLIGSLPEQEGGTTLLLVMVFRFESKKRPMVWDLRPEGLTLV